MSVFDELLEIKAFRESKAETEVTRTRGEAAVRQQEEEAAAAALAAWKKESLERELALYADLCARIVRLRDIESVQQEVGFFRQREQQRQEALQQAEKARVAAQEALSGALQVLLEATRMKEKFVELADDFALALSREAEYKEDMEMEEAASVMHQREELARWEEAQAEEELLARKAAEAEAEEAAARAGRSSAEAEND